MLITWLIFWIRSQQTLITRALTKFQKKIFVKKEKKFASFKNIYNFEKKIKKKKTKKTVWQQKQKGIGRADWALKNRTKKDWVQINLAHFGGTQAGPAAAAAAAAEDKGTKQHPHIITP